MFDQYTESVLIFMAINVLLALSLYLPVSAGLLSLGQGGFMAIGAYASAYLTVNLAWPFIPALLVGSGLAGLVGLAVGFPALRIKGVYLIILTMGFGEIVRVFFDPAQVSYDALLKTFWERHDPTQGLRQGNDIGSQYRSAIYCIDDAQMTAAEASRERYQRSLDAAKLGSITTEIRPAPEFFAAEDYHQQYLAKNPDGYCGLGGTGVVCVV